MINRNEGFQLRVDEDFAQNLEHVESASYNSGESEEGKDI